MNSVEFDSINYPDVTLQSALADLSKRVKDKDPDGKGINFLDIRTPVARLLEADADGRPVAPNLDKDSVDITQVRVRVSLQNVRLADVLDAITKTADHPIKYQMDDYGIYFSLRDTNEPTPLEIRTFKVDPNIFIQGLQGVVGVPVAGGVGGGVSPTAGQVSVTGGGGIGAGNGIQYVTGSDSTAVIGQAIRAFFNAAGVVLNSNAVVFFNDRKGTLTVRATSQDLDLIEQAIATINTPQPTTDTPPGGAGPGRIEQAPAAADNSSALEIRTFRLDRNTFVLNAESALGTNWNTNHEGSSDFANLVRAYLRASGADLGTNAVVIFNDRKSTLTVRATAQELHLVEAVIQTLNSSPPEINIKLRLVEITQNPANGFNWCLGNFSVTNGGTTNVSGISVFPRAMSNGITGTNLSGQTASFTGILTQPRYQMVLSAVQPGDMKMLAEPNITVESGRQAQIQNLTAKTVVYSGSNGYTTSNMSFGTTVDVRASVSGDEFSIHMDLTPTITEFLGYDPPVKESKGYVTGPTGPGGRVNAVPVIRTRTMNTSVTVWDGQTVVLSGLATDDVVTVKDQVPLLGDIPLMGRLFSSKSSQTVKKQILIFVTPTIVNPDGTRYHSDDEMPFAAPGRR